MVRTAAVRSSRREPRPPERGLERCTRRRWASSPTHVFRRYLRLRPPLRARPGSTDQSSRSSRARFSNLDRSSCRLSPSSGGSWQAIEEQFSRLDAAESLANRCRAKTPCLLRPRAVARVSEISNAWPSPLPRELGTRHDASKSARRERNEDHTAQRLGDLSYYGNMASSLAAPTPSSTRPKTSHYRDGSRMIDVLGTDRAPRAVVHGSTIAVGRRAQPRSLRIRTTSPAPHFVPSAVSRSCAHSWTCNGLVQHDVAASTQGRKCDATRYRPPQVTSSTG